MPEPDCFLRYRITVGVCDEFRSPSAYWPATAIRYCADQTPEVVWPRGPADKSQDHSRALQACISPAPRNWRRRPGRPRHTWLRTVEEDLRQFDLGLASGLRRAQNRTAWRTLTGTATSPTSSDWWWDAMLSSGCRRSINVTRLTVVSEWVIYSTERELVCRSSPG